MDVKCGNSHYLLIQSLSCLACDRTKYKATTSVCPFCLYCFSKEELNSHIPECRIHPPQHLEYPSPQNDNDTDYNILKFRNFSKKLSVSMVLYCDFETFMVQVDPNGTKSKSITKELHKLNRFSCLRLAQDPSYTGDIFTHSELTVMGLL